MSGSYRPVPLVELSPALTSVSSVTVTSPALRYHDEGGSSSSTSLSAFARLNAQLDDLLSVEEGSEEDSEDEEYKVKDEKMVLEGGSPVEGMARLERDFSLTSKRSRIHRIRRYCIILLSAILFLVLLFTAAAVPPVVRKTNRYKSGLKPITFEHATNGTFAVKRTDIRWLREAGDGVHAEVDTTGVRLVDVEANTTRQLFRSADLVDPRTKQPLVWRGFSVSADMRWSLVDTNWTKVWRWSSLSNFWLHDNQKGTRLALGEHALPPKTSFVKWAPAGESLIYVSSSDLYFLSSPTSAPVRLTTTGNATLFHGLCDWVYEEEIFSRPDAVWFSPDGRKFVWLSFDETEVPEYEFPVYSKGTEAGMEGPYTSKTVMRYPKPGYPNPSVSLSLFDVDKYEAVKLSAVPTEQAVAEATFDVRLDDAFEVHDRLVVDVAFVSDQDLLVTQTNRISTVQKVMHFDLGKLGSGSGGAGVLVGKVVRDVDWEKRDGGWYDPAQSITSFGSDRLQPGTTAVSDLAKGYLDVIPDDKGYVHIALFSPPDSGTPLFLTSGEWEVDGGIKGIDLEKGLFYFIAANPPTERHLFSMPLPTVSSLSTLQAGSAYVQPTSLTNRTERSWYTASFSPFAGYYALGYEGPDVPWQKLLKTGDSKFEISIEDNSALRATISTLARPTKQWSSLKTADGQDVNAMELLPPGMDTTGRTKYPVLVRVYGGPGSQMVHSKFDLDWHHHLASSLSYVVLVVDARGTGSRGRGFRSVVRNRLGEKEREDVVFAVGEYAEREWVDEKRVGIWGWSYGGYLTSKVVETNSTTFSLAISVAPVTDWRFYDSIYTERYMSLPSTNAGGYNRSAVWEMGGFERMGPGFALAHGSGDDNVHFLNSATLLDRLTVAKVRGFRFRLFPDSDHAIDTRGAHTELMRWLTDFLYERWGEARGDRHERVSWR